MTLRRLVPALLLGASLALAVWFFAPGDGDAPATYRLTDTGPSAEKRRGAGGRPTSGAMAALQWQARQRSYPGDRYPRTGWLEAPARQGDSAARRTPTDRAHHQRGTRRQRDR